VIGKSQSLLDSSVCCHLVKAEPNRGSRRLPELQPQPATAPDRRRPATDAEVRALSSTTRLRILRLCLGMALTNREIAERLDRHPASVLHHVRTLTEHGFLVAEPPRRGRRGAREIPYHATGLSWRLSTAHQARRDLLLATFLEEVAAVGEQHLDSTRLGLHLGEDEIIEFRDRLQALLDEFARRPPSDRGARWSIYIGQHPEPGSTPPSGG